MREIAYNKQYGGFSISKEGTEYLADKGNPESKIYLNRSINRETWWDWHPSPDVLARHDPLLIEMIRRIQDKANGQCCSLAIATVKGAYKIEEHDGKENVIDGYDYGWN